MFFFFFFFLPPFVNLRVDFSPVVGRTSRIHLQRRLARGSAETRRPDAHLPRKTLFLTHFTLATQRHTTWNEYIDSPGPSYLFLFCNIDSLLREILKMLCVATKRDGMMTGVQKGREGEREESVYSAFS